jgi:hypothetical protein
LPLRLFDVGCGISRLGFLNVRTGGRGGEGTLTGSSAVRFDAAGAAGFDATGLTFELGVVGVVEDCCVGAEGTVD